MRTQLRYLRKRLLRMSLRKLLPANVARYKYYVGELSACQAAARSSRAACGTIDAEAARHGASSRTLRAYRHACMHVCSASQRQRSCRPRRALRKGR
jgi:hypothetical protein